jgi:hypothetical protein
VILAPRPHVRRVSASGRQSCTEPRPASGGIETEPTLSSASHRTPVLRSLTHPFSHRAPVPKEQQTLQLRYYKNILKKLCSANSGCKYCNMKKKCTATFQAVVLQHRKNIYCNDPKISLQHSKIICCNIPCNTGRGNRTPELVGTLVTVASLRSRGGERGGGGLRSREEPACERVEEVCPTGRTSDKERYRLSKVLEGLRPLYEKIKLNKQGEFYINI